MPEMLDLSEIKEFEQALQAGNPAHHQQQQQQEKKPKSCSTLTSLLASTPNNTMLASSYPSTTEVDVERSKSLGNFSSSNGLNRLLSLGLHRSASYSVGEGNDFSTVSSEGGSPSTNNSEKDSGTGGRSSRKVPRTIETRDSSSLRKEQTTSSSSPSKPHKPIEKMPSSEAGLAVLNELANFFDYPLFPKTRPAEGQKTRTNEIPQLESIDELLGSFFGVQTPSNFRTNNAGTRGTSDSNSSSSSSKDRSTSEKGAYLNHRSGRKSNFPPKSIPLLLPPRRSIPINHHRTGTMGFTRSPAVDISELFRSTEHNPTAEEIPSSVTVMHNDSFHPLSTRSSSVPTLQQGHPDNAFTSTSSGESIGPSSMEQMSSSYQYQLKSSLKKYPSFNGYANRYESDQQADGSSLSSSLESASTKDMKPSVSFSNLSIREYDVALVDHPECSYGPPIGLGWDYKDCGEVTVDAYERRQHRRRYRAHKGSLLLSYQVRSYILQHLAGYTKCELRQAMQEVEKIKKQRQVTEMFLPASQLDELMEQVVDGVKHVFLRNQ
eukprot:CAMPEP_0118715302 /NCGR_PEP_ID=MMETSP0800-20121206/26790_1 /TAXON_ID=210618 ORGANISM="Striatella unipunctata, Strain CCMP2910" /NCGR_SAMPLE_ID=MMETSP0800 /ASSEMBLY_ACC=CAM_ASM_000638 /LENGTH=547 /DNA_ID=CAMNT_0006621437 /DNA_START=602 /DNA_END=2245 /DNA_ORIENTATION=+